MTPLPALKGEVSNLWVSGVIVWILLISVFFYLLTSLWLVMNNEINVSQPLTKERLCGFPAFKTIDLGDKSRCLVE